MDISEVTFAEYLEAKRRLDDRSINRVVFNSLERYLSSADQGEPRLLELGAGLGTMIERLLDWGELDHGHYTAVDSNRSLLDQIPGRLAEWASRRQGSLASGNSGLELTIPGVSLTVDLVEDDILSFLDRRAASGQYNLILAHAVMDLLDLDRVLPSIRRALQAGGQIYLTINFDGGTVFEPVFDPDLDRRLIDAYHATMDQRRVAGKRAGHSQTGRRLLARLPEYGFEIVRAGASDWVIHPGRRAYDQDDEIVLRWMLGTVEKALAGDERLAPADLREWLARRSDQLARGQLIFIAHQLDVHARLHD